MTPELSPVQRRNRLGLDRGMVVALAMTAFIAVLVIRPWSAPDEPAQSKVSTPDAAETGAIPSAPARVAPLLVPARQTISLGELRALAESSAALAPPAAPAAIFGTTFDLTGVEYRGTTPAAGDLGANCVGGAMLGDGNDAIGILFDGGSDVAGMASLSVERLFEPGPAIYVPIITIEKAADGVVLTTGLGLPWSAGHYALVVRTRSSLRILPFCIGRMIRLVDYSLITFVPSSVDGPIARLALLAQIARP